MVVRLDLLPLKQGLLQVELLFMRILLLVEGQLFKHPVQCIRVTCGSKRVMVRMDQVRRKSGALICLLKRPCHSVLLISSCSRRFPPFSRRRLHSLDFDQFSCNLSNSLVVRPNCHMVRPVPIRWMWRQRERAEVVRVIWVA